LNAYVGRNAAMFKGLTFASRQITGTDAATNDFNRSGQRMHAIAVRRMARTTGRRWLH
jgi:hypothetical protein